MIDQISDTISIWSSITFRTWNLPYIISYKCIKCEVQGFSYCWQVLSTMEILVSGKQNQSSTHLMYKYIYNHQSTKGFPLLFWQIETGVFIIFFPPCGQDISKKIHTYFKRWWQTVVTSSIFLYNSGTMLKYFPSIL